MVARATSNESKKANGTFTPARERRTPKLRAAEPAMPEGLPESAQKVWKRIVPELAEAKLLACIDLDVLAVYCTKMGAFYEDWGASMTAADLTQLRMLMAELGLTPAARLKTPPLEDEPETPWTPKSSGNVVTIAGLRSSTRKVSATDGSTPADTSASPASVS